MKCVKEYIYMGAMSPPPSPHLTQRNKNLHGERPPLIITLCTKSRTLYFPSPNLELCTYNIKLPSPPYPQRPLSPSPHTSPRFIRHAKMQLLLIQRKRLGNPLDIHEGRKKKNQDNKFSYPPLYDLSFRQKRLHITPPSCA